jgi:hypothetical protein
MPKSSRDLTSKERKEKLAASIVANGIMLPTKCYHCTQAGVLCCTDLRSGRCAECARLGQSCNRQNTRIEYERICLNRRKVAKELEEAEAAEDDLTRKLLEHRARIRRLRKKLRTQDEKESQAQDIEATSITKAVYEETLLIDRTDPDSLDLQMLQMLFSSGVEDISELQQGPFLDAICPNQPSP